MSSPRESARPAAGRLACALVVAPLALVAAARTAGLVVRRRRQRSLDDGTFWTGQARRQDAMRFTVSSARVGAFLASARRHGHEVSDVERAGTEVRFTVRLRA